MNNKIHTITDIIVAIGALNWGIVGFTNMFIGTSFDLVDWFWVGLLKAPLFLADLTYVIVGIAAIIFIVRIAKRMGMMGNGSMMMGRGRGDGNMNMGNRDGGMTDSGTDQKMK